MFVDVIPIEHTVFSLLCLFSGGDSALKPSGVNQLQQVEILEIAKCNLEKIPPSLEEPGNPGFFVCILFFSQQN